MSGWGGPRRKGPYGKYNIQNKEPRLHLTTSIRPDTLAWLEAQRDAPKLGINKVIDTMVEYFRLHKLNVTDYHVVNGTSTLSEEQQAQTPEEEAD